jgi:hypothetical protein
LNSNLGKPFNNSNQTATSLRSRSERLESSSVQALLTSQRQPFGRSLIALNETDHMTTRPANATTAQANLILP